MLIISLVLGILAVARITRLVVEDRLTVSWRQWVVRKYGEESLPSYLVHCPWCMSLWVSIPVMPVSVLIPQGISVTSILIAVLAIPAASMVAGLLNSGD